MCALNSDLILLSQAFTEVLDRCFIEVFIASSWSGKKLRFNFVYEQTISFRSNVTGEKKVLSVCAFAK